MARVTAATLLCAILTLGSGCEGAPTGVADGGAGAGATGSPPEASVTQEPAAAAPANSSALPASQWQLRSIRRPDGSEAAVTEPGTFTIEFGVDGRYSGLAHCNRYTGGWAQTEPRGLALTGGASTRMACPEPSLEFEYLTALGQVTSFEGDEETLRLNYATGGVLIFVPVGSPQAAAGEVGRTFVFDCAGSTSFTVRTGPGEVALWAPAELGSRYIILAATPAASGARFASEDVVYWNRGAVASFEIGGQRFVDCPSNPAKVPWADAARRGVVFRALGNEPAWNVEVYADRFVVVTDLGASRKETPYIAAELSGMSTTYRGATAIPSVRVDRVACTDTMSGDLFEATATATLEDRILYGCGRFL